MLEFADGGRLALRDKRRLGRAVLEPDFSHVGPDAAEVGRDEFRERVGRGSAPLKARLLDQGVISGRRQPAGRRDPLARADEPAAAGGRAHDRRARPPAPLGPRRPARRDQATAARTPATSRRTASAAAAARAAAPSSSGPRSAAGRRSGARPASLTWFRRLRSPVASSTARLTASHGLVGVHPCAGQQVGGGRADLADDHADGEVAGALEHERGGRRRAQGMLAHARHAPAACRARRRARARPRRARAPRRRSGAARSRRAARRGSCRARARARCGPRGRPGSATSGVALDAAAQAPPRRREARHLAARDRRRR